MKFFVFTLLSIIAVIDIYGQCDTIMFEYYMKDPIKVWKGKKEIINPKDSLQINFTDGFDNKSLVVKVDSVIKTFNNSVDEDMTLVRSLSFKRPNRNTKIEVKYDGISAIISYDYHYNTIHIGGSDCFVTVQFTNRMIDSNYEQQKNKSH